MIEWSTKTFNDFTVNEFHDLIALRIEVFIIEQDCPYQELDGKDKKSLHVIANCEGDIVATARIVPPGISYEEPSIGRVVIAEKYRGTGLGHELMKQTMTATHSTYGNSAIRISAQEHLIRYYNAHGFKRVSEVYLEDDIPHVEMLYTP